MYVEKADDLQMVNESMVPPLLDAILLDYQRNVPDARDAEVLNVVTTIIHKLRVRWTPTQSRHSVRGFAHAHLELLADGLTEHDG